jgi:tight adherence protein B
MDIIVELIGPYAENTWFIMFAVPALVFAAVYLAWEHILVFVEKTAFQHKDEIKRMLDLIYVDIEEQLLSRYLILCSYGLGGVLFLMFFPNFLAGLIVGAMVVFAGIKVPLLVIQSIYEKRCKKVVDQMLDGMTIMANGTKAGNPPSVAMERVIENIKGPLSQEFKLVKSKARLGMSFEEALVEMSDRVPEPDVQMFVMSVNILKETGGKIDQTFETINKTIRERQKLEKKISAMTSQGITQGIIISLVPFFLMGFFWFADRPHIEPLFTTTYGLIMLCGVFVLQIMGGLMIKKIVTIKV